MLPFQKLSAEIELSAIFLEESFTISNDWFDNSLAAPLSFVLALSDKALYFSASQNRTPSLNSIAKPGQFFEGLWEHDVVELFLKDDNTSAYQEINLAPNGAWWTKRFRSYRERDDTAQINQSAIFAFHEIKENSWRAALKIERRELQINCAFQEKSRGNVCGITGIKPRQFFSIAKASTPKPDFHLPDLMRQLSAKN